MLRRTHTKHCNSEKIISSEKAQVLIKINGKTQEHFFD